MDDICNFVPARFAAVMMMLAAFFLRFDFKGAVRIFKRDRFAHLSPNSAQTEAVAAGALQIQLEEHIITLESSGETDNR